MNYSEARVALVHLVQRESNDFENDILEHGWRTGQDNPFQAQRKEWNCNDEVKKHH